MLTTSDLKAIKKIVREEVGVEVKGSAKALENQIRLSRMQIQNEIRDVDNRVKNVEVAFSDVKKDLKVVKKDLKYLKKTVDIVVKNYDEGDFKLDRRLRKIEAHLNLASEN